MYISDLRQQHVWTRYMAVDRMRHCKQLLHSSPELERFSINGENFCQHALDDEQVFELVNALRLYQGGRDSTIREVVLESFAISKVGWKSLSGALQQLFRLKKLFLRQISVVSPYDTNDRDDDDEGVYLVKGLSGLVLSCPHLEELHLVNCNIHATACQILLRDFVAEPSQESPLESATFPGLRVLSLEGNEIGDMGVKSIARALRGNRSLLALDLDRVGCSESGINSLTEALKENDCLETVSLVGNGFLGGTQPIVIDSKSHATEGDSDGHDAIHNQAAQNCAFCHLLTKNKHLKRVQLHADDPLSPSSSSSSLRQVDFLLRLNRRGRKYLGDADIMSKIFHLILESSSNDADVLYYFLKSQSGTMRYRSPA